MTNGWTRGQYSIYRYLFGLYLIQHFLALLPWGTELFSSAGALSQGSLSPLMRAFPNVFWIWDSPLAVGLSLGMAAVFSAFFMVGKFDRVAAVLIWYLWACFLGRNPLISNPSLPFIGWLLLAHMLTPSASKAKESAVAGNEENKSLPRDIYLAAWILMSLAYTYSGYTKLISPSWVDGSALGRVLENPLARDTILRTFLLSLPAWCLQGATWGALALELSFAPLALFRRCRPLIWTAMTGLHLGLMMMVNFTDLTAGMLVLHLFTFDPAWLASPKPAGEYIFFDGHCALCHGMVRFVLQEDQSRQPFCFAPLQGNFAERTIPERTRASLPDSVAVLDNHENVLVRSAAVIYILKRLGGLWFVAAMLFRLVPRALRDRAYNLVASMRKRIFGTTEQMCPLVPAPWRERFRN